jgi:hypothetical protein
MTYLAQRLSFRAMMVLELAATADLEGIIKARIAACRKSGLLADPPKTVVLLAK